MTRKLFGTDGVRGTANKEPITARTALELALAAGAQFRRGTTATGWLSARIRGSRAICWSRR